MPIINVQMVEGRTSEQKAKLAKAVTDAVIESLGVSAQAVRILISEMKSDGFYVAGERSAGASQHGEPTQIFEETQIKISDDETKEAVDV